MTQTLLLRLGTTLLDPVEWSLAENGVVQSGGVVDNVDDLRAIVDPLEPEQSIAFLPAEATTLRTMSAPPKSLVKFRAAASYILEDVLCEPIENIHFGVQQPFIGEKDDTTEAGVTDSNASTPGLILATSAETVEGWLAALTAAGVELDVLTSDAAGLIDPAGAPRVIIDGNRVLVAGPGIAVACEADLFEFVRSDLAEAAGAPLSSVSDAPLLPLLAMQSGRVTGVNLLQGRFARRWDWRADVARLRRPAAIAAGIAALLFVTVAAEAWRKDRMATRWRALTTELHASSFPDARTADPVVHARRVLQSGEAGASFTGLSSTVAAAIESAEGVQVDRLNFDAARGRIVVSVRSRTDDAIEAFREALAARGVTVRDNGGYRRSRGQWVGELIAETA